MDIQTIDSNYSQLQAQAQQTVAELKELAQKHRARHPGGTKPGLQPASVAA